MRRIFVAILSVVATVAVANADTTPPAAVTDLAASPGRTSIVITWTATGDDGYIGTATSYDLRYSTYPINANNFYDAARITVPAPKSSGQGECFVLTGQPSCTTFYFAIKVLDEVPNTSGISNLPSCKTLCSGNNEVECP